MKIMIMVIGITNAEMAIGFIKSRKSESRVMDMSEQMYRFVEKYNMVLEDILVDDQSGYDVDRYLIDSMMESMESGKYRTILIRKINDITDDPVEQNHFVRKVQSCGGSIVSIYDGQIAWNDEEC